MNGWLLDTNVVYELREIHPNYRVKTQSDVQLPTALPLSTVILATIRHGNADHLFQAELTTWRG